jgi:anti-anti-sigma factor
MTLQIDVKPVSSQKTVVTLSGRLDRVSSPDAEKALGPVLSAPPRQLVFDLAALDFISSAGLRVVLGARKKQAEAGSECLIVNMKPHVEKVFEAIKALPALKAFRTVAELDAYLASLQQDGK